VDQVNRFLMTKAVLSNIERQNFSFQFKVLYFSVFAWIRHPDPQQEKCWIRIRNIKDLWDFRQKPKQINAFVF
jgi:hypothetical protein